MQTWGSHGDVRPFVALAEGLQRAGHEVTLVLTCVDNAAYAGMVSPTGVKIRMVASPVVDPAESEKIGRIAYRMNNPLKQLKMLLSLCFEPAEEAMFAAAQELAEESDVLIGHHFMYPTRIAAERAAKPFVSVLLSHAGVPTSYSHPLGLPFGHRFMWWLTRKLLHMAVSPYPNRLRRRLGMAPVTDVVNQIWLSDVLTLVGVSPSLCKREPDWAPSIQVCGFLDMPNMQLEGRLTDTLEAFLNAGEAPVYMTFGSWTPRDIGLQTETLRLFTDAARRSGCRAIIQCHDAAACGFQSDGQILYVSASPHHLIFPRCVAVVHHGGAGTTQATTLAGRPSVIVAHISEQEHWALELRKLGVAGKPLKRRSVSARSLAARIGAVLREPDMTRQAQLAARPMAQEDGVATAVRMIGDAVKSG